MSYKRKFDAKLVIDSQDHPLQDLTDIEVDSPQNRSTSSTSTDHSSGSINRSTTNSNSNKRQKVVVLNRWSDDENSRLIAAIDIYGENNWRKVSEYVATRDSCK